MHDGCKYDVCAEQHRSECNFLQLALVCIVGNKCHMATTTSSETAVPEVNEQGQHRARLTTAPRKRVREVSGQDANAQNKRKEARWSRAQQKPRPPRDRSVDVKHKWSVFNSQAQRCGIVQRLSLEQYLTVIRMPCFYCGKGVIA